MSVVKKASVKGKEYDDIIVRDKVRSYANEPYFVKKAAEAKEFLRKHPLPDHLKK